MKKSAIIAGCILVVSLVALGLTKCSHCHRKVAELFSKSGISRSVVEPDYEGMQVHFLNVGKADCAYIQCGQNNILIDAADKEPEDTVVNYLSRQGVTHLDLVIVSHPHRDHIGQMDKVLNSFKVGTFMEPEIPDKAVPTTATYLNMLKSLQKSSAKARFAKAGETFNVGDMRVEILGPISQSDNLNNNSIVAKISYKDVSFLFTGDAEKSEERGIINSGQNIKADVLKVAHHGSITSSGVDFLNEVNPKYAIISVMKDSSNLPKQQVLKRLREFCGENVYRTDKFGNIVVFTDGKNINVTTEFRGRA